MKKWLIALFIFALLTGTSLVRAGMPETHYYIDIKASEGVPNTPGGIIVSRHQEDFLVCNLLTDISVFYYFSEGFYSIGQVYKDTHAIELCRRMMELAGNDEVRLACAYGVCAHHVQDSVFHNVIVPDVISSTGLPNGIVHALAEEKINDMIISSSKGSNLKMGVREALIRRAPAHKEMFREALIPKFSSSHVNFDDMYDKFVDTVASSSKYSPGFRGFTAVPTSIHIILMLILFFSLAVFFLFTTKYNRSTLSKPVRIFCTVLVSIIGILYILFFTNTLWMAFETLSTPLSAPIPVTNLQSNLNIAVENTKNLLAHGVSATIGISDPAGETSLKNADASNTPAYIFIGIVLAVSMIFIIHSIRKKKRRKR